VAAKTYDSPATSFDAFAIILSEVGNGFKIWRKTLG
jgi:hypothetical protein